VQEIFLQLFADSDIISCMDDPVDLAILAAISQDGRATLAHLSETVGLSAEAFEGTITDLYMPKKA